MAVDLVEGLEEGLKRIFRVNGEMTEKLSKKHLLGWSWVRVPLPHVEAQVESKWQANWVVQRIDRVSPCACRWSPCAVEIAPRVRGVGEKGSVESRYIKGSVG